MVKIKTEETYHIPKGKQRYHTADDRLTNYWSQIISQNKATVDKDIVKNSDDSLDMTVTTTWNSEEDYNNWLHFFKTYEVSRNQWNNENEITKTTTVTIL
jgi:hypothetical protein